MCYWMRILTRQLKKPLNTCFEKLAYLKKNMKKFGLTEYPKSNAEKAKYFINGLEDPTKLVNYDKKESDKYKSDV